jgi:hypothetical protein
MRLRMLLLPAVASVALLAGCAGTPTPEASPTPTTNGLDALEADEILQKATDALDEAGSFRLSGSGEEEGQPVEVDAVFAGDLLQGTFTTSGLEIEIIVAQEGTYLKAGEELWESFSAMLPPDAANVVPLLSGKWVKIPQGADGGLVPQASDFLTPSGDFTKGDVTEYDGHPAITLVDEDDSKLYISLVGEPYPLAIESAEGTLEFSEIGEDAEIEAPTGADVVDLEQFLG